MLLATPRCKQARRRATKETNGRETGRITIDADQKAEFARQDHVTMRQLGPVKQSLAVVALLFLLLRPLCDVWAAGDGHAQAGSTAQSSAWQDDHGVSPHDGGSCCATIGDGALAKPSEAGAMAIGTHGQAAIAAAAWVPAAYGSVSLPATRKPPGAPPPALSYHARSARIQR